MDQVPLWSIDIQIIHTLGSFICSSVFFFAGFGDSFFVRVFARRRGCFHLQRKVIWDRFWGVLDPFGSS